MAKDTLTYVFLLISRYSFFFLFFFLLNFVELLLLYLEIFQDELVLPGGRASYQMEERDKLGLMERNYVLQVKLSSL